MFCFTHHFPSLFLKVRICIQSWKYIWKSVESHLRISTPEQATKPTLSELFCQSRRNLGAGGGWLSPPPFLGRYINPILIEVGGWEDYAHHIINPLGFSNFPTALQCILLLSQFSGDKPVLSHFYQCGGESGKLVWIILLKPLLVRSLNRK